MSYNHMKYFLCIILPVISVLSVSCYGLSKDHDYFAGMKICDLDSIPNIHVDSLETMDIDVDGIGVPRTLIMVDNERLAFLDRDAKAQVKLLDLKSGRINSAVSIGEGPDEILNITSMILKENNLWLGGIYDKKIGKIDLSSESLPLEILGTTKEMFQYLVPIDTIKFLTSPLTINNERFHITNLKSKETKTAGKFPIVDTNANNAVFQGEASLSPDGKVIIIVDKSWGIVELLDAGNLSVRSLTYGPDKIESVINVIESAQGTRFKQSPLYLVLAGISAADDSFFVGYIGGSSKNWDTMSKGISRIIQYNYDGDAVKSYELPEEIVRFAVDRTGTTLYGIRESLKDGNMQLVKCSLK